MEKHYDRPWKQIKQQGEPTLPGFEHIPTITDIMESILDIEPEKGGN
jgi:hypothetical protein